MLCYRSYHWHEVSSQLADGNVCNHNKLEFNGKIDKKSGFSVRLTISFSHQLFSTPLFVILRTSSVVMNHRRHDVLLMNDPVACWTPGKERRYLTIVNLREVYESQKNTVESPSGNVNVVPETIDKNCYEQIVRHGVRIQKPPERRHNPEAVEPQDLALLSVKIVESHRSSSRLVALQEVLVEIQVSIPSNAGDEEAAKKKNHRAGNLADSNFLSLDYASSRVARVDRQLKRLKLLVSVLREVPSQIVKHPDEECDRSKSVAQTIHVVSGCADLGTLAIHVYALSGHKSIEIVHPRTHLEEQHSDPPLHKSLAGYAFGRCHCDHHVGEADGVRRYPIPLADPDESIEQRGQRAEQIEIRAVQKQSFDSDRADGIQIARYDRRVVLLILARSRAQCIVPDPVVQMVIHYEEIKKS